MNRARPAPRESADRLPVSRRRIVVNFLTLAGTNVFGLLVTILISVYVRRAMGPEAIGQVSWAMAAIACLTALVSPGLTFVGQRELAQSPERSQSFITLGLSLQTLLACIVYAFVLVAASFEPRGAVVGTLLAIQGVTLFVTAWNTGWALQAHERMVAPSLAALAFNILQLPALMLLVHGPDDLTLYAVLVVAFGSVFFNILYLARRGILHPFRLRPTLAGARGLVREAWPLALTQAALLVIASSGALLLGFTHGDDAVGQFVSAYRLMLVANVVTAALWNAYFPAFVRAEKRRSRRYRCRVSTLACWSGWACRPRPLAGRSAAMSSKCSTVQPLPLRVGISNGFASPLHSTSSTTAWFLRWCPGGAAASSSA